MIHRFVNNGYHIILDVNSGAIHVTDANMYEAIGVYEALLNAADVPAADALKAAAAKADPGNAADLCADAAVSEDAFRRALAETVPSIPEGERDEYYEEIRSLIDDGALFTPDTGYDDVIARMPHSKVVKALCLNVAHDCNLACRYCFADEGEYHGKRELMSVETGKKALDFLIANSGARKNLEVDFFGGEPLMNWKVVKELVAYGREQEKIHDKNFRFTLTTNGMLLNDEVMEFANREMDNVVLSLDGRKEVNDRMRPVHGSHGTVGSYDIIVPKELAMAKSRQGKKYYVRGTYTHENPDFCADVLHMRELGFDQISVEPVVAPPEEPYALKEEDLPVLFEEYDKLAAEMARRMGTEEDFTFFHFMIDLEGGPCVAKRLSGCGSGTEYLSITPNGDIYPCHQFVGKPEFVMGNVNEGVTRDDLRMEFASCNVYAKPECRECFARFYCSGGCAANAYNESGSILGNYAIGCALQKKRVECAIMLQAVKAEREEIGA